MTAIEWTEKTWNPTTGCERVSPGCDSCYAMAMARRLKAMGNPKYQRDGHPLTSGPGFGVSVHEDVFGLPLRWRKPRRIFVDSMADLFHQHVPDEAIAGVFAVMAAAHWHTFQLLTKRHARMRSLLNDPDFRALVQSESADLANEGVDVMTGNPWETWPLANVHLGVSVESQRWADMRIPALLETPAAVRWISAEPLVGPIDLFGPLEEPGPHRRRLTYWLHGRPGYGPGEPTATGLLMQPLTVGPRLDWVVCGGESGNGARPMHPDWARTLRDQCQQAGVPFMFKQWGAWAPTGQVGIGGTNPRRELLVGDPDERGRREVIHRTTKKDAGRVLDGRTWDEYPKAVAA